MRQADGEKGCALTRGGLTDGGSAFAAAG